MPKRNFATATKLVKVLAAAADAAGRAGRAVNLKNAGYATVIVNISQGNAAVVPITLQQARDVAGTGAKALTNPVPIWANLDTDATDTLVRQADAVAFTTDAAVKSKTVVFHIDPAYLDVTNGYRTLIVSTGASNAGNVTSVDVLLDGHRYQSEPLPSAIVD
ncbi:hypothetical protein [Methylorubrum sp. SB2]|uniref:hypothetical protein n=1 Tax=Methylorubrum subtropicum TaxID=3138812 RepID=UPI00313AED80